MIQSSLWSNLHVNRDLWNEKNSNFLPWWVKKCWPENSNTKLHGFKVYSDHLLTSSNDITFSNHRKCFTDMAVQNCIGDSFRGATWVALHNGGGCGWGEVMNGGFGLVLDGSDEAEERSQCMLQWDVSNGVSGNMVRLHMDWLILYAELLNTLMSPWPWLMGFFFYQPWREIK